MQHLKGELARFTFVSLSLKLLFKVHTLPLDVHKFSEYYCSDFFERGRNLLIPTKRVNVTTNSHENTVPLSVTVKPNRPRAFEGQSEKTCAQ